MELTINAKIICTDGEAGHLNGIILKPTSDQVTHIVVKWHHQDYVLPVTHILTDSHQQITLNCSRKYLQTQPLFVEIDYIREPIKHQVFLPDGSSFQPYITMGTYTVKHEHVPEGELAVKRGMKVFVKDEKQEVGRVGELIIDPRQYHLTQLILREGHLWGEKEVIIDVSHIKEINDDGVYLKMTHAEVEALPVVSVKRHPWS